MKDAALRTFTKAFTSSAGIGTEALIAAVPGFKVRVTGFSLGSNALNNVFFVNSVAGTAIYTTLYGPTVYGRAYSEQAGGDNYLFQSADDNGVSYSHNGGSVPCSVSLQYKLIPNTL
jgi:hypothetical protein